MSVDMTPVLEVGRKLVDLCNQGKHRQAIEQLYADDAKHVEACAMGPDMPRETAGKDALLKMADWWSENHEVHGGETKGPFPHGDQRFAVYMAIDVTPKVGPMAGKRHTLEEVCLYHIHNGRIKEAEFFWDPTGYGE